MDNEDIARAMTEDILMSVQTKEHVLTLLRGHHPHIKAFGVKRLGLFGSFLHGHPNEDSDVDVLVEFIHGYKTFDHFIQLAFYLESLFDRRVELVTPESLSPYFGPQILSEVEYVTFDDRVPTAYSQ
jgi:predicted nucleotidyltransferase